MRSQDFTRSTGQRVIAQDAAAFMQRVYGWMTLGLFVTGFSALYVASSPAAIQFIFGSSISVFLVIGVQLALVFSIRPVMRRQGWQAGRDSVPALQRDAGRHRFHPAPALHVHLRGPRRFSSPAARSAD